MPLENVMFSKKPLYFSRDREVRHWLKWVNIEGAAMFFFSFCVGLVTELNNSTLGVLKHHYVAKRTHKL